MNGDNRHQGFGRIHNIRWLIWGSLVIILGLVEIYHFRFEKGIATHLLSWGISSLAALVLIEIYSRVLQKNKKFLEECLQEIQFQSNRQDTLIQLSSKLFSMHDENMICQTVITELKRTLGYERVSLVLENPINGTPDNHSNEIDPGIDREIEDKPVRQLPNSIPGKTGSGNSPMQSRLIRVSAPLRIGSKQIGDLVIENYRECAFSSEEMSVIYAAANQAALAIENARLFENQRRQQNEAEERQSELYLREHYLTSLNRITREALRTRGFTAMLDTLTNHLCELFYADSCLLALWDEKQKLPIIQTIAGKTSELFNNTNFEPSERFLSASLVNSGKALIIQNPADSPYISSRLASRLESRAILGLPLIANEQKFGTVLISFTREHTFTELEISFGEQAASQIALALSKERALSLAQYRAKELDALQSATSALLTTIDLEKLLGQILDAAMRANPVAKKGVLHLVVPETGQLQLRAAHGYKDPRIRIIQPTSSESYAAKAVRYRRPLSIPDLHSDAGGGNIPAAMPEGSDFPNAPEISSLIVAPLILGDRALGAIALGSYRRFAFTKDDLNLLVSFAATATTALNNAQLHEIVQKQAISDPLTGLYNRRGFYKLAQLEITRCLRFKRPLSMVLIDIDHFKQINDTHGHLVGDLILTNISSTCKTELRQVDLFARFGGDEFIALLPETDLEVAAQVAERLRLRVEELKLPAEEELIRVSICAGVATLNQGDDIQALIERTDRALYQSKQTGRNRVEYLE